MDDSAAFDFAATLEELKKTQPTLRRISELDEDEEDPFGYFIAQLAIIIDELVAAALRNERTGQGKGLREMGLSATADELGRP